LSLFHSHIDKSCYTFVEFATESAHTCSWFVLNSED